MPRAKHDQGLDIIAALEKCSPMRRREIVEKTGIANGSMSQILRRLISEGAIHIMKGTRGAAAYAAGCSPTHRDRDHRPFYVDASQPGAHGGRVVRFGDQYPANKAMRPKVRGLSGSGSSLNNIYG